MKKDVLHVAAVFALWTLGQLLWAALGLFVIFPAMGDASHEAIFAFVAAPYVALLALSFFDGYRKGCFEF